MSCIAQPPDECWRNFYIRKKIKTKWFHISETHAHHSFWLIVYFDSNVDVNQTKTVLEEMKLSGMNNP